MFTKKNGSGGEIETIVGPSVSLKGNLKSEGNIKLKGKVSGEIKTKSDVLIDEGAEVRAIISAKNVRISGTVTGDINASGEVEINEKGKVLGNVISGTLVIRMGAVFVGKSAMELEASLEEEKKEAKKEERKEKKIIEPEPEIE